MNGGDQRVVSKMADAMKARLCLMFGGIFGLHRAYLGQYPEAFIMLTTLGGFALGVIVDSFRIHAIVDAHNARLIDESERKKRLLEMQQEYSEAEALNGTEAVKNGIKQFKQTRSTDRQETVTATQFALETLYGTYLCAIAWCTLEFLDKSGQLVLWKVVLLSLASSSGVYIAGSVGNRAVKFAICFQTAFVALFLMSYLTRNVLFICILPSCSTVIFVHILNLYSANQSRRKFTIRNFIFWTSLFNLLLATLFIGVSRHIFDLRITVRDSVSKGSTTATLGTLTTNYLFFDSHETIRFFADNHNIHYALSGYDKQNARWFHYLGVAVTDGLRYNINLQNYKGDTAETPATWKWVAWRIWLLVNVQLPAHTEDKTISTKCAEINSRMPTSLRSHIPHSNQDAPLFSPTFACHRFTSGLKVFS